MAYGRSANNFPKAIEYLTKAHNMDPKVEMYMEDLGVAYGLSGRIDESIAITEKIIAVNPKYPPAYINLALSYMNKGDMQKSNQYLAKYNELTGKNITSLR